MPDELMDYILEMQQHDLSPPTDIPEWLKNFLASDDEYDTFSK
jgi:hypothetical protein